MRLVDFKHEFNRQEFLPAIWADFTIVNDNSYPVKDLRIYCAFQDAAGAKVKDMTLHLYTIVPAKSQRREHHNLASLTKEIENASCILFDAHRHFE